jgi:hypothetical protein
MQRELNAILTVLAVGYDVTIEINGMNIGVKGQKSESIKLFGKKNPTVTVLPEDMKNQICLIEGNNSISVTCKRIDEKSSPELTIEVQARDLFVNGATNFCKKEKINVGEEKSFTDIFSV